MVLSVVAIYGIELAVSVAGWQSGAKGGRGRSLHVTFAIHK